MNQTIRLDYLAFGVRASRLGGESNIIKFMDSLFLDRNSAEDNPNILSPVYT